MWSANDRAAQSAGSGACPVLKRIGATAAFFVVLLFFLAPSAYAGKVIRILYMNDFHGFAVPYRPLGADEPLGGLAWLAGRADVLRQHKPSLLLAAGDMIQGNNWANLFKGRPCIEAMNAMGFDAMVLGNHEFDFGQAVLRQRISEAKFPVLAANVEGFGDGLRAYTIRKVDGVRVAIIGVVTDEVPITTSPANAAGLIFLPPAETVSRFVGELRSRADIVIVLSHVGYYEDRALAEKVKGIDVIVGGHSHTKLERPAVVDGTIIVQAWEHAKALGILDITVDGGKISKFHGRLEEIRPIPGKEDRRIAEIVEKYESQVDAVLGEKVGVAGVDLDGENVRKRETNLGDLVADVMKKVSGADAAIINGGSIRTGVRSGPIRAGDIYSVLPFDNYIVAVKLTGAQIRSALEHGVSAVERGEGRFPQVSGIRFSYSISARPGERVRDVSIGGRPLEPGRKYAVATNDFLAAGGDGYSAFGDAVRSSADFRTIGGDMKGEKLLYSDSGRWLRDVMIDFIKKEKKQISPEVQGRIVELP